MDIDNYVWYKDDDDKLHSVGYPIQNIFKQLDIPAIRGSHHPLGCKAELHNLAIPAGLVYMHSMIESPPQEEYIAIEPTTEDLYSRLLSFVEGKKPKTRRRKRGKKKKTRKKNS